MSDDFNPDTLLSDIDKIMEQQGYSSLSASRGPIEVEAADSATISPTGPAPSEEMMSRIDRVIHPQDEQNVPIVDEINSGFTQGNQSPRPQSQASQPDPRMSAATQPVKTAPQPAHKVSAATQPAKTAPQPDPRVSAASQPTRTAQQPARTAPLPKPEKSVSETIMPPDTEAAPMFTTIDEPIEWKLDDSPASESLSSDSTDYEEIPPVSYLEGASADGYQVENVAFGDISVGVETESVEFSVGHPLLRLLRNILICVAAALLLSLLVTKFVAHHTTVDGSSMMTTLSDGDQLIVQQLSYYFHDPERFDIVVFPISTEDNYIKRVIGLPGETVQIIDGQVYINGNLLTEDHYGSERIVDPGNAADTIYLQADEYFVLGDNRNASVDSRFSEVGVIKRKDIKAKAWLRFYPFGSFGFVS